MYMLSNSLNNTLVTSTSVSVNLLYHIQAGNQSLMVACHGLSPSKCIGQNKNKWKTIEMQYSMWYRSSYLFRITSSLYTKSFRNLITLEKWGMPNNIT